MSEQEETVEVTLRLPKPVVDWFKSECESHGEAVEDWLTQEIVQLAFAQIECTNAEMLMHKYKLKAVFKEFEVLPEYYGDP